MVLEKRAHKDTTRNYVLQKVYTSSSPDNSHNFLSSYEGMNYAKH